MVNLCLPSSFASKCFFLLVIANVCLSCHGKEQQFLRSVTSINKGAERLLVEIPDLDDRALLHENITCVNQVDEVQIRRDNEFVVINCDKKLKKKDIPNVCPFYDETTFQKVYQICPLLCKDQSGCDDKKNDNEKPEIELPFQFKCENQVKQVEVTLGDKKKDKPKKYKCQDEPSDETDQTVCRQFDQITHFQVWQVCPLMCSYSQCPFCSNKVSELQVLDDSSTKITVECLDTPGDNSVYCFQYNGNTGRLAWLDCPLMCPNQSGCNGK